MPVIDTLFDPLYGKPCWLARQGYGSFLTFEFGEPHLKIVEPRKVRPQASEKIKKWNARRHVFIHGDWHLWIYLSDWRIFSFGQEIANHESNRRVIKKATSELDGQHLVRVDVSNIFTTIFEFDLGGRLEVIPNVIDYENTVDLWLLYEPNGDVFSLRADGKYSHKPGSTSKDDESWQTLDS